jgi:hypothetical protein
MALICDPSIARFGWKGLESGAKAPVRGADTPKRAIDGPRLAGRDLFAAELRPVVSHDALASLLPKALSANKNICVTASAIYESMT